MLIQSLEDEFDAPANFSRNLPSPPIGKLKSDGAPLTEEEKKSCRSGGRKLFSLMRHSLPDMLYAARESSKWISDGAIIYHKKVVHKMIKHVIHTKNRGPNLKPTLLFNHRNAKFIIKGKMDRNYATNPETRKSVSVFEVTLNGAPVVMRSVGQKIISLSVTEAEILVLTLGMQEMIHVMRFLESMGLCAENPMCLESDNKGSIDVCNNGSINGQTKHMDVRNYFLRKLKENGVLEFRWIPGEMNSVDLFTKNLPNQEFAKHAGSYCTDEIY